MAAQYSALAFTDPEVFRLATGDWDVDFRQLDPGHTESTIERLGSAAVVINRLNLSRRFHQRGSAPAGAVSFGLPNHEAVQSWLGRPLDRPTLLNFSRTSEYDSTSRPTFSAHAIAIPDAVFQNIATATGINTTPDQIRYGCGDFILGAEQLSAMNRALSELIDYCSGGTQSQFVELELQDNFLLSIMAVIDSAPIATNRSQPSARAKAVDRAVDYICSTHGRMKMSDVYEKSLTSWRTLDRGFMERFGVGPKKFLTAVRLSSVRQTLMAEPPETTIATIAAEYGFYHEGRFSAVFKNMFGELPSECRRG